MRGAGAEAALVEHRPMLFGLAYRLLGSAHDADDVLQEAYLRWLGTDRQRLAGAQRFTAPPAEQERLLRHFLAAAREGDLPALTRLLASDATAWSDGGGKVRAARNPLNGADRIARFFAGIYGRRPPTVRWITANGHPAALINDAAVLALAADATGIRAIYLISNPTKLTAWAQFRGNRALHPDVRAQYP